MAADSDAPIERSALDHDSPGDCTGAAACEDAIDASFVIVNGDEGEEANGGGEADPVEITARGAVDHGEEGSDVPVEITEEKGDDDGLLVVEEKIKIEAGEKDEKNEEASEEEGGIKGEGEERVEEGKDSSLESNAGTEADVAIDAEGIHGEEMETATGMQSDAPAEVNGEPLTAVSVEGGGVDPVPAVVVEDEVPVEGHDTKVNLQDTEIKVVTSESIDPVDLGAAPPVEAGEENRESENEIVPMEAALADEPLSDIREEEQQNPEIVVNETDTLEKSDPDILVEQTGKLDAAVVDEKPDILVEETGKLDAAVIDEKPDILVEETGKLDGAVVDEKPDILVEEMGKLDSAVVDEKPDILVEEMGELDSAFVDEKPDILVEETGKLDAAVVDEKPDILVEETGKFNAAVVDEKLEPEDVVAESRDYKVDSVSDPEREQNIVTASSEESALTFGLDDKEKHVMEYTPIENDRADVSNEVEVLPAVNELSEHAEEVGSEINLKSEDRHVKDDDQQAACEVCVAAEQIQESPSLTAIDGEKTDAPAIKRHFCYLIKVPKYIDEMVDKKLQDSNAELEKKTQIRNSLADAMRKQKVIVNELKEKLQAVRVEERAARDALNLKRKEVDAAQSMLDKMKTAIDIDDKIHGLEQKMQHETLILKQEKQYIIELKKLRQQRDELYSTIGSQEDFQKAFEQRDQTEGHLKLLRKQVDSLKTELALVEDRAKSAKMEHDTEYRHLQDLRGKHGDANDIQQESYLQLRKLKRDFSEKNKYYYMYKEDRRAADNFALIGDKEGIKNHCSNQVEKVMELWNNNEEFRKQYIESNEVSTVRRLRTRDGRSLGPGEEPPVLRSNVDKLSSEVPLSSSSIETTSAQGTIQKKPSTLPKPENKDVLPSPKVVQANQSAKSKKSTKPTSKVNPAILASNQEEDEMADMGKRLTKEEEELARKEEELRKEKAAAELKEKLRLEQIAKAKEAEERKKRKAEKAQAKAQYKAQKEAEEKEKRRVKKEKKKVGIMETDEHAEGDSALDSVINPPEIAREVEATAATVSKRSSKPHPAAKSTNKVRPLPLPLRNRSKRKMETWMWVLLVTVLILAFFFAGSFISASESIFPSFGF